MEHVCLSWDALTDNFIYVCPAVAACVVRGAGGTADRQATVSGGGRVAPAGLTANQALAAFLQLGDARRPIPAAFSDALAAIIAMGEPRAHVLVQHAALLLPDIDVACCVVRLRARSTFCISSRAWASACCPASTRT